MAFIADNWFYFLIGIVLVPFLIMMYLDSPLRKRWWEKKNWDEPLTPSEAAQINRQRKWEEKQKAKETAHDKEV